MKLVFLDKVIRVEPRTPTLSIHGQKPNERIERGPTMWWLQVGPISFNCGLEKPDFKVGQKVRVSIEPAAKECRR